MKNKKTSFRRAFQSGLLVFFIAIIIMQASMMLFLNMFIKSANEEYGSGAAKSVSHRINEQISKIERASETIAQNQNIQLYLTSSDEYRKKQLLGIIRNDVLKALQYANDSMYVLAWSCGGLSHEIINTLDDVDKELVENFYADNKAGSLKNGIRIYVARNSIIICKFRDIYKYELSSVGYGNVGVVCIVSKINISELKSSVNIAEDVQLELINDSSGERYELIAPAEPRGDYMQSQERISDTQWNIICGIPKDRVPAVYKTVRDYIILVFLLCIVFMLLFTTMFRKLLIKPINKIFGYLDAYSIGEKKERLSSVGTEELDGLLTHINGMIELIEKDTREIVKTQEELYEKEIEVKDVLLYMYQLQVQPHFLYNTLGCINGFAIEHGADEILEITDALADIFRYSMEEKNTVTLGDEVRYTQKYMGIQKLRFPQLVDLRIDIDDSLLKAEAPKMILQPIVENAFKHGILQTKEKGIIHIKAKAEKDTLVISVKDTGAGMTAEKLGELRKSIRNYKKQKCQDGRIGISNVCKRIYLRYGDSFGVKISSKENDGTTVTIKLPLRFVEAEDG